MLQVIDEDRDGSESGGESCTPAVQSCPGVSLLSGVEGPGDHPLQPADVCIPPILYWIDILYLFQATEYAEFPFDEAVPVTTLVKVEALDLDAGQLGPEPEVCFLIPYSALTYPAVVVDEQQRDPHLCV